MFRSHLGVFTARVNNSCALMGVFCCVRNFLHAFLFSWRYVTISTKDLLINDDIKCKEVRLVGPESEQLGIMDLNQAKEYAYDRDLDLVLIAPNAVPPVCRAMDYGKYCFERDKKEKEARKKQQIVKVKEVQLSCRIDTHDFETRVNQARKFLAGGDKVRAIVRFKGREMAHMDLGRDILLRFQAACEGVGSCEKAPNVEGRFMSIILSPVKQ
jgi:translation initiation factor IF-3